MPDRRVQSMEKRGVFNMNSRSAFLGGIALLLLGSLPVGQSAIMSVDFGSRFIKVAMVQKGKPFHIVVDETSKRKVPAIVAFDDGQRHFGNGAKALSVRKPQKSYEKIRNLLGVPNDSKFSEYYMAGGYPHVIKPSEDGRGVSSMEVDLGTEKTDVSIEQLIAMNLEHIKKICETDAEEPVVDAVISVPNNWNADQRRAMITAGELAGLNILSLVNENTAAAIQYGIDLNYKTNTSETVAIYNMGDSLTQVSVIKYSSYSKKRGLSNKTIGQLEVLSTATTPLLGGDAFDRVITNYLVGSFNELAKSKGHKDYDIRQRGRPMAKLRAAANKAKHVLSANQEVPVYIESLDLDIDFKSHLTREQFYGMAEGLLARVYEPVEEALAEANVTASDLKHTLVIGGSVRIPAVQKKLRENLGPDGLGFSLDGDESIALGAAFMAANLSTAFRVRPIGLVDKLLDPISIDVDSPAGEDEESEPVYHKSTSIFKKGQKIGGKKTVNFKHDRDFSVAVSYKDVEDGGISMYNITGVKKAISKVKNATDEKPKVQLSFKLTTSGTVEFVGAQISIQKRTLKTKPKAKATPTDSLFNSNQTYERCETQSEDGEETLCGSCGFYAMTCDTFGECDKREKEKKDEKNPLGGLLLRFPLGVNDTCTYHKADDDKDSGCYKSYPTGPCYSAVKNETKEPEKDEEESKPEETKEPEKPEEPEYKLIRVTRQLTSKYSEYGAIKGLSSVQKKEEMALLKKLKERDETKIRIAETKNRLESYVYAARGVLRDEVGEEVTTEEEREQLLEGLEGVEDWLYEQDDADDTVEKFQIKLRETKQIMAAVEHRAKEYEKRPIAMGKCDELMEKAEKWISKLQNRTWIKEDDIKSLQEKVNDFKSWVKEITDKQEALSLTDPPHYNASQVYTKVSVLARAAERLLSKKKPKAPPKPLHYIRCESGKNKTACGRCTHYAGGCSFDTCKSNSTRYGLYGNSRCTYSKTEEGCTYKSSKDSVKVYPCYKGVPKKSSKTSKDQNPTNSTNSTDSTNSTKQEGSDPGSKEGFNEGESEKSETEKGGDEDAESASEEQEDSKDPEKDEL
ncbi:hypothetical protein AAMO2058_000521600 [Amorphochlora amoebiformis]